jgi:hypothetical protein
MRMAVASLAFLGACATGPTWQGAGARARHALETGDTREMVASLAQLLGRFNLPVELSVDMPARAQHLGERIAAGLGALAEGPKDRRVAALLFSLLAADLALEAQRTHLPDEAVESDRLAVQHAAALLLELGRENADLLRLLASAMDLLRRLSPAERRDLPGSLWEIAKRLGAPGGHPLAVLLSRSFPSSFDRSTMRVLHAMPKTRLCTLRSVDAEEGTLAAVSAEGKLYLASLRELRELSPEGPEVRRRLPRPLGPGRLVHLGARLYHVAVSRGSLELTALALAKEEARPEGVLVVRGSGFFRDAVPLDSDTLLAFRRTFPGYATVRLDFSARRARTEGALPGAAGYRDGQLGEARFSPGPTARLGRGALVFFDPPASSLRILDRGWVGTVVRGGGAKDGVGRDARVGQVAALAAAGDDLLYLADEGPLGATKAGFRQFHLRKLRFSGGPCQ